MSRDLMTEIVKLEPIVVELTLFYPFLEEHSDNIWASFAKSDKQKLLSAVDLFTINVPNRVWMNKINNGFQKLLDYTTFDSELEMNIATGKTKLVSLDDL